MISASVGFQCPECVKAAPQKVLRPSDLQPTDILVKVLVGINVVVFFLSTSSSTIRLRVGLIAPSIGVGADVYEGVSDGAIWRIVTSGFLHADFLHVGFNMYLLWMLGRAMERMMGPARLGILYFVGMLGGSFGALYLDPEALTIGASGAVFGLMGAFVATQLARGQNPMEGGIIGSIGGLVAINLVFTFADDRISVGGHVGGLLAGAVVGALYAKLGDERKQMPAAIGLSVLLGAVLIAGCIWAAGRPLA